MHKHRTQNFRRISPFGTTPVKKKKHTRLGHAGIVDHSVVLSIPGFKKYNKGMDRSKKKNSKIYKCTTANTSATRQHAAHTTDPTYLSQLLNTSHTKKLIS